MLRKIKWFLSNLWYYRKFLWSTRDYDHVYAMDAFILSLERLRDGINKYQNHLYYKIDLKNINRAIRTLKRYNTGTTEYDIAERKYNCKKNKELYYQEVRRIEKIIKKKAIRYLMNPQTGLETWWD